MGRYMPQLPLGPSVLNMEMELVKGANQTLVRITHLLENSGDLNHT